MITLSAENAKTIADRYLSTAAYVDTAFRLVMDEAGKVTLKILQKNVNVQTGALRDSMKYQLERTSAGGYKVTFCATATAKSDGTYYVDYVDQGTRPHTIRVRNKVALHFFDRSGNEVFAQAVYHPGYKGSKFSEKSAAEASPMMEAIMLKLADNIRKKVTG
jgi:hypothetical protein